MSEEGQHSDIPKHEHHPIQQNPKTTGHEGNHENGAYQHTTTFDNLHGPFNQHDLFPNRYQGLDYRQSGVNYQHMFQPPGFTTYQPEMFQPRPLDASANSAVFNPTYSEQPWVEEIHQSYTAVGNDMFAWTPSDPGLYGWIADTPSTIPSQQQFENSPIVLPTNQFSPISAVPESLVTHGFVPGTMPYVPPQHSLSVRPVSTAIRVRNEKLKKEFNPFQYEKPDPSGHRPLRVSKTKKLQKTENNRKQEACWRCKRYRKACVGEGVCRECATAGFRVWPSAIGCRRGAMEGFVEKLMPSHSIGILQGLRVGVSRGPNWRKALCLPTEASESARITISADRWDQLRSKVQSTLMFGADFAALVDIVAKYECAQKTEIPIWTTAFTLLSSTCDFYHFFVKASDAEVQLPAMVNATIKFRKSLQRSWDLFLKLCLSGRRENWFPAFLTVCLGICSMVILMDAVPSVPGPTRKAIWGDIEAMIKDLRVRQHMMTLDLLQIGGKGINPLKLGCWVMEEEIDSNGQMVLRRSEKGMTMLGQDAAAFDGYMALCQWYSKWKSVMQEGMDMWESTPYTLDHVRAIASMSRIFEF